MDGVLVCFDFEGGIVATAPEEISDVEILTELEIETCKLEGAYLALITAPSGTEVIVQYQREYG